MTDFTGWPPGLLQDDCRKLSRWFASRLDARRVVDQLGREIRERKTMSLHAKIMNIRCDVDANVPVGCGEAMAYKHGHSDARHAAAELALEADAEIERLMEIAREAAEAATKHQAEVLRLRAALEKIADWDSNWGPYPETNEAWRAMAVVTAREAVPRAIDAAMKGKP